MIAGSMDECDLVLTGDMSFGEGCGHDGGSGGLPSADGVARLIGDDDFVVGNLRTVLADESTSPPHDPHDQFTRDAPEHTVVTLQRLGVDAVSLANTHTMGYGRDALAGTAEYLREAGVQPFGAGDGAEHAAQPLVHRVHLAGHTKNVYLLGALKNSARLRERRQVFASEEAWGIHPLATQGIIDQLTRLRAVDPAALIILYPHWGQPYTWASDLMRRTAPRFLAAGADLIVGHGARMLQEVHHTEHGSTVFSAGTFLDAVDGDGAGGDAAPYSLVARVRLRVSDGDWQASLRLYPIVTGAAGQSRPVTRSEAYSVFRLLAKRSGGARSFSRRFALDVDARGWHLLQVRPISPRFAPVSRPALAGRWRARLAPAVARRVATTGTTQDSGPGQRNGHGTIGPAITSRGLRYGGTDDLYAAALEARGIDYTSGIISRGDHRRTALRFTINGVHYAVAVAMIYLVREDGTVLRPLEKGAARAFDRKDRITKHLRENSFRVPRGEIFDRANRDRARAYFAGHSTEFAHGFCLKPVHGRHGRDVHTGIHTAFEFEAALDAILAGNDEVVVQEMLPGEVYRFLWIGGRVAAVRVGIPMNVLGDGTSTITELVEAKNAERRGNPVHARYPLTLGKRELDRLRRVELTPESVPPAGEMVYLSGTSNLHQGADIVDCTGEVHPSHLAEVERAVASVPGMLVCGADVIIRDHRQPAARDNHGIIELNRAPGIRGHHFPWSGSSRDVAGEIIDLLLSLGPADHEEERTVEAMRR
ncbi:CapA family protein [Haloechinothrix sp. LS1_15]|uniref:CapA family protein n=1 Tax=Haloechinothrix sp. LS1_15 TaxID=2652248 RepID=UPI002946F090|nr:CapA family protein [Haloechinothrix sp. LS1_15]MDV6011077.1 hypothetical protein [Haloechinothrix sp. LS1_15]